MSLVSCSSSCAGRTDDQSARARREGHSVHGRPNSCLPAGKTNAAAGPLANLSAPCALAQVIAAFHAGATAPWLQRLAATRALPVASTPAQCLGTSRLPCLLWPCSRPLTCSCCVRRDRARTVQLPIRGVGPTPNFRVHHQVCCAAARRVVSLSLLLILMFQQHHGL